MAISSEQRLYGQLIVDFANADTTDKAGLKYIENVQKAFGLTSQFVDKAKAIFPVLSGFLSTLTKTEKKCFGLISEIKILENHIGSAINAASLKYDVYSNIFHVGTHGSDNAEPAVRDLSIEEMKEMLQSNCMYPDSQKYNENILLFSLPKLLVLGKKASALKKRYQQISELEDAYVAVKLEHGRIEEIQGKLDSLLDGIVKNGIIDNNEILDEILEGYFDNNKKIFQDHITKSVIINKTLFDEAYFTDRDGSSVLFLDNIYTSPIAFSLIEFSRETKNIEYLKKCELCKKFYVTNKLIGRQKRCSVCSRKTRLTPEENTIYQREIYRPAKKKQKEAKIKKYMAAGMTRKEAEELIKNDA